MFPVLTVQALISQEKPREEANPGPTDVSVLEGILNENTNWYESSWFGTFYAGKGGWIFHQKLGWLYIHPSSTNGFWSWDPTYNSWWWSCKQEVSSSNIFYFYLYSSDPEKRVGEDLILVVVNPASTNSSNQHGYSDETETQYCFRPN